MGKQRKTLSRADTVEITVVGSAPKANLNLIWFQKKKPPNRSKLRHRNHLFYNTLILRCRDKLLTVQLRSSPVMSADSHCAKTTAKCEYVVLFHSTAGFRDRATDRVCTVLFSDKYQNMNVWTLLQNNITPPDSVVDYLY